MRWLPTILSTLGRGYGDLFCTLGRDCACGKRLDPLERVCRVVAIATGVTDSDHHFLKNHKAGFVFKRFALDALCLYRAFTVHTSSRTAPS